MYNFNFSICKVIYLGCCCIHQRWCFRRFEYTLKSHDDDCSEWAFCKNEFYNWIPSIKHDSSHLINAQTYVIRVHLKGHHHHIWKIKLKILSISDAFSFCFLLMINRYQWSKLLAINYYNWNCSKFAEYVTKCQKFFDSVN